MKRCGTCKHEKMETEFCRSSSYRDGLNYRCRQCSTKAQQKHYAVPSNRKKQTQRAKTWRDRNLDRERFKERERYRQSPERFAKASRKWYFKRYGLTPEQADDLKKGGCWVCGSVAHLHIDHEHSTKGTYRGVLCSACNTTLGLCADDPVRLRRAAAYLEGKLMSDTYGFGGASPSRDVPNRDGDATKSGTGDKPDSGLEYTYRDAEHTGDIAGTSPVSGLEDPTSEWEHTSIHPSWADNVPDGPGVSTGVGSWPLSTAPAPASVPAGGEDSDYTGHKPGTADTPGGP